MKKVKLIIVLIVSIIGFQNVSAQGWISNSPNVIYPVNSILNLKPINVGIGTSSPVSLFSVNGVGDNRYSSYFFSDGVANGSHALFAESSRSSTFAGKANAITGKIESGMGYTFGVRGIATTANPINRGRGFGVYGLASNADYNYGVYAELAGKNFGSALVAIDRQAFPSWNGLVANGHWAGYFLGNTHISQKLGIGTTNITANLHSKGTVRFEDIPLLPTGKTGYILVVDANGNVYKTKCTIDNNCKLNR